MKVNESPVIKKINIGIIVNATNPIVIKLPEKDHRQVMMKAIILMNISEIIPSSSPLCPPITLTI